MRSFWLWKSTVGKTLSEKIDIPFYGGDDFHPKENVVKMESGIPLCKVQQLWP